MYSPERTTTPATMTEDNWPSVESSESVASTDSPMTKPRKKRRWDEPAELLVSAGLALLPGTLPLVNGESLAGIRHPSLAPVTNICVANPLAANGAALLPGLQSPLQQHAVTVAQKLNLPKIQDELIAREIVINDADSAVRYKLTKRQTQEEIQRCTGAVVITRGKYIPPNVPPAGEKPLYLHISAGSHLETTVERIKAVDHAAVMVEEMLKQGISGVKGNHLLSTCVYLGFEPDISWNIASRIRGPNDQYINHIMNETGATVLLRGRGADSETTQDEGQQPLHLFLASNNPKSLEQAKLLAENLLDTISSQFGASRVSSCKVYGAVPPPPQLLEGVQDDVNESKASATSNMSTMGSMPTVSLPTVNGLTGGVPQGIALHSGISLSSVQSQTTTNCYPLPTLSGTTSYNGYAGIYPQATPLQQVALALRQSTSPITATVPSVTTNTTSHASVNSAEKEKRPPQKRKFQELPVAVKGPTNFQQHPGQGSSPQKPYDHGPEVGAILPPPKSLVHQSSGRTMRPSLNDIVKSSSNIMPPPPPPKTMPPPPPKSRPSPSPGMLENNNTSLSNRLLSLPPKVMPLPPPKFKSSPSSAVQENKKTPNELKSKSVPDTLIKLMEYGDDDDDD